MCGAAGERSVARSRARLASATAPNGSRDPTAQAKGLQELSLALSNNISETSRRLGIDRDLFGYRGGISDELEGEIRDRYIRSAHTPADVRKSTSTLKFVRSSLTPAIGHR